MSSLLQTTMHSTTHTKDSTTSTNGDSHSSMLSPPLSPHPKLATLSRSAAITDDTERDYTLKSIQQQQQQLQQLQGTSPESSPALANLTLAKPQLQLPSEDEESHDELGGVSSVPAATTTTRQQQLEAVPKSLAKPVEAETKATVDEVNSSTPYRLPRYDPNTPMVSNAWTQYQKNRKAYFQQEMRYYGFYNVQKDPTFNNYISLGAIKLKPRAQVKANNNASGRSKRRVFNLPDEPEAMTTRSTSRGGNHHSTTPHRAAVTKTSSSRQSTPKPARTGASGGNGSRYHDVNLEQIPDYAPSTENLSKKDLKTEWKGSPMDLSHDPDLHLLHPAEVALASTLRLSCATYLDSKKRLFAEKVERVRQGRDFRRTDSQKACRIDVNKASRLFAAFEKAGWLKDSLFAKYL